MIDASVQAALDNELIHEGDTVVITGGTAGSPAGSSDLMKVQMIKKLLGQGDGIGTQVVTGRVRILEAPVDPMLALDADEIIVTAKTDRSFVNVAQRAAGLVTEESGMNSHSSMLAVELGIPAIVGISGATSRLQDGQMITLDTRQGHVYAGAAH